MKNSKLFFIGLVLAVFAIFAVYWWWVAGEYPNIGERGTFGDSFGTLTAFFSALAFLGMIYAITLQTKELGCQREELQLAREEQEKQREEMSLGRKELEKQREEMEKNRKQQYEANRIACEAVLESRRSRELDMYRAEVDIETCFITITGGSGFNSQRRLDAIVSLETKMTVLKKLQNEEQTREELRLTKPNP